MSISCLQVVYCEWFEKILDDSSYSAFIQTYKGGPKYCKQFSECKIIAVPHVIGKSLGSGWIFPKHSALHPLFDKYVSIIRESGQYDKLKAAYNDQLILKTTCAQNDGKPIDLWKSFSLFGMLSLAAIISVIILM